MLVLLPLWEGERIFSIFVVVGTGRVVSAVVVVGELSLAWGNVSLLWGPGDMSSLVWTGRDFVGDGNGIR